MLVGHDEDRAWIPQSPLLDGTDLGDRAIQVLPEPAEFERRRDGDQTEILGGGESRSGERGQGDPGEKGEESATGRHDGRFGVRLGGRGRVDRGSGCGSPSRFGMKSDAESLLPVTARIFSIVAWVVFCRKVSIFESFDFDTPDAFERASSVTCICARYALRG